MLPITISGRPREAEGLEGVMDRPPLLVAVRSSSRATAGMRGPTFLRKCAARAAAGLRLHQL